MSKTSQARHRIYCWQS